MKAEDLVLDELVSFENGKLMLHGRRLVIHDMFAFAHLRRESINMLGMDNTRRMLTRFGYFWGQEDAAAMERLFTWDSSDELLRAGPRLHSMQGVVRSMIKELKYGDDTTRFQMKVIWHDSGEANEHLEAAGESESPVCWMLVGYASGYASYCLDSQVYFIERKCRATGDHVCTAEGRLHKDWDEEINEHLPFFQSEDIHGKIVELSDNLRRQMQILERERQRRKELEQGGSAYFAEARSPAYQHVLNLSRRVAPYDTTVLITGETGVGKEIVAQDIHKNSARADQDFLAINCSALPETLLESELFGHKKGAFTGAGEDRVGMFEQADGGTLFLDEIGDISSTVQLRLLRVLQENEIKRVGESKPRKVNVRILAATNRDLSKAMQEGNFREDLYFRLSVVEIAVPPLRERPEDILPLTRFFIKQFSKKLNIPKLHLDATCLDYFLNYSWPGNVRELENTIENTAVLSPSEKVLPEYIPAKILNENKTTEEETPIGSKLSLEQVENAHIRRVLKEAGGNRKKAADILGISSTTLWRRLKNSESLDKSY